MKTVGAWVTRSSMLEPTRAVESLLRCRCNMASVMVNNYAKTFDETPFRTWPVESIVAFTDAARAAGIEITLTTWVMPHASFIDEMAAQLLPLMEITGATALILDVEEPWVQAKGAQSHDEAAAQIDDLMGDIPLVMSAISSANEDALEALAVVCVTWSPQAYATTKNDDVVNAATIVQRSREKWEDKFGAPRDGWIMGLAGFRQPSDPAEYMSPCVTGVYYEELDEVCYWDIGQMDNRADVMAFVASVRSSSGCMPTLDIAEMQSRVWSQAVAHVQGLLNGWGISAGVVDGKPGARTLAAVREFQGRRGLAVTGIVDGGTWTQMIGE